jgi:hypothetical protein
MQNLHHSDIVTYALTRLASESYRDLNETLRGLKARMRESGGLQDSSESSEDAVVEEEPVAAEEDKKGFTAGRLGPPA